MRSQVKGFCFLLLTAIVWGMAFTAQSNAAAHLPSYTVVFLRSAITFPILLAARPLVDRIAGEAAPDRRSWKRHLAVGALCGTFLVFASVLQQKGLETTTPAKSGFITALYIILVPVLGIPLGRRPRWTLWLSMLLALIGLYFLCWSGALAINAGDLYTLACALMFSVHILLVDRWGAQLNSTLLSAVQFAASAVWAGALMLLFEHPTFAGLRACIWDILYIAIFSSAIGYTFQIVGQKHVNPTLASLLMCLESVFAALGGWMLLGNVLSARELLGCGLMLGASALALLTGERRA